MKALGFSNGWAELALKKPPPLLPSSLIASWLATGPPVQHLGVPGERLHRRVGEVLDHPAGEQQDRGHERQRQQDAQGAAGQVDPEVARATPLRTRTKPRMSATAMAMPTAADRKFCTARPAICAVKPSVDSPGVGLPVGVGDEGDRGVEGHPERQPGMSRLIGRCGLAEQEPISRTMLTSEKPTTLRRVGPRALLGVGVHAGQAIDDPLDAQVSWRWCRRAPCSRRAGRTPARAAR